MTDAILLKVKKLLALAHDGGATEAEAALAAAKVQELLQDHGLSIAQVEQHDPDMNKRTKLRTDRPAHAPHHATIMGALATNNFCMHQVFKTFRPDLRGNKYRIHDGVRTCGWETKRHLLVGRDINVQATLLTYDYLIAATDTAADDAGYSHRSKDRNYFMDGIASRLSDRLGERRREREVASRATPNRTNGTGRELVLSDVYGNEADLNNDVLNNFPAGTTATKRREQAERSVKQETEHDRLVAEGVDTNEAWYRAYGYEPARAAEFAKRFNRRRGSRGRTRKWTSG